MLQDYDVVAAIQKQALENPLEAVEKLKTPEGLGIPEMQILAEVSKFREHSLIFHPFEDSRNRLVQI